MIALPIVIVLLVLAAVLAAQNFGMNREYERAVLFRLGRIGHTKGPGWYWLVPLARPGRESGPAHITVSLETQETVTRDGVAVKVNAVLWFHASDPVKAITAVQIWHAAVVQAAETGMRDAIGQSDLDQLLKERMQINARLMEMLSHTVSRWGVTIDAVEVKDLDIPEQMQRAIAREAEAIRDKRARVIMAEGEQVRRDAGRGGGRWPRRRALDLRRLQTLTEIGAENSSLVVAMVPTELLEAAQRFARPAGSAGA